MGVSLKKPFMHEFIAGLDWNAGPAKKTLYIVTVHLDHNTLHTIKLPLKSVDVDL